jgi:hypothetical protein
MIDSLAIMLVFKDITFNTRTVVALFQVRAVLSTKTRRAAFVEILAHPRVGCIKHLSIRTSAQSSIRRLNTSVRAAVLVAVSIVTAKTFIGLIRTVVITITDLININAHPFKIRALPFSRRASDRRRLTTMLGRLVRSVTAIVFTIADKAFVNALFVVALEVIVGAVHRAAGAGLVRVVFAVRGAVAVPAGRDAHP